MHVTSKTTVPASVDKVWDLLSDHAGMSDWGPGLKAALVSRGTSEANGVGAIRRIEAPGPMPAVIEEITVFERPRRLGYKALSGAPLRNYHGDVQLRPTEAGTEIVYRVSADQRIPFVDRAVAKVISLALLTALARQARR